MEGWQHHPLTKEALRYLLWLKEQQKDDWANGSMMGNSQMEAGYLSMIGRAKVVAIDELIRDMFTSEEKISGK